MKSLRIIVVLTMLGVSGCATSKIEPPARHTQNYSGHPAIELPVRRELERQAALVGYATNSAWAIPFYGVRIEPEGQNADGYYGLMKDSSVHGAYRGARFMDWPTFWFAFPENSKPDADTVSHECLHHTGIYFEGIGGHPDTLFLNGKTWKAHDMIIAGARWPMRVLKVAKRVATFWRPKGFSDVVNGEYFGPDDTWHKD